MTVRQNLRAYPRGIFRPEVPAIPLLARAGLRSRIAGPDARKVTVVTAPLGYGKTILLTQAYDALESQGRLCVWLAADRVFGDGLTELLWEAADRAGIPTPPSVPMTPNGLIARIERAARPVTIFIDGLDRTGPPETALRHLLRAASQDIAFVVATETDLRLPLMRLEAAGLLRRIDASDLAFDEADVEALGRDAVPCLPASTLHARSEGWPAIVQLALCRSRDRPDLAPFPLSGVQHEVATFLEQDVLGDLDRDLFARLLDASVVDRVCGSLLDALSGGRDGAERLNALVGRGVPMQRSRPGEWFRLHPLLRDYLYDRLQRRDADRLALLHQRAADWWLTFGDERAALRHGTASGNIDFLRRIYQGGAPEQALPAADRSSPWIGGGVPQTTFDPASRPAWRDILKLIQAGQIDMARKAFARMEPQDPAFAPGDPSKESVVEWERTYIDLLMRVFDDRLPSPGQLETLRDRLMRTPGVPPPVPAAVSELVIVSRFRGGDLSHAMEADRNLWHTSALGPPQSRIYLLIELGIMAIEIGDLDLAVHHLCNARRLATHILGPDSAPANAASTVLAEVAFERGEHDASVRRLDETFLRMKPEEVWFNVAASAFTTRSAEAAWRSWQEALTALELPHSLAANVGLWRLQPLLIAQRLRLAVVWGHDLDSAREDWARLSGMGLLDLNELIDGAFGWRVCVPAQLAVIRFDLADRKAEAALARAVALRPALEARRQVRRLIELNLLQGRALIGLGDPGAGRALVRDALSLSAKSGMVQSVLQEMRFLDPLIGELLLDDDLPARDRDFFRRLLTRVAQPQGSMRYVVGGRTVDLSSREAQLLRALATGKTFKEIAFSLNISINTTKMHRTRLYRKLGCNCRSLAIAMAQDLVAGSGRTITPP